MRRTLVAVLGVALLLGSVGWGTASGAMQTGNETTTENATPDSANATTMTIRVSAVGEAEGEPNQAIVRVAVVQSGNDAEAVRNRLARNASRMRDALEDFDIEDDQIRTVAFDIGEDRDEKGDPAGFRGIHTFEITLNDTSRVGSVIDTAVENGANEVEGVTFALSDARRDELRARALETAMKDARTDAETIAEAENVSVTGVRNVSTADSSFAVEAQATTVTDAGGTDIESGPVTVAVQVVVTYEAGLD